MIVKVIYCPKDDLRYIVGEKPDGSRIHLGTRITSRAAHEFANAAQIAADAA